jgi:thiol-disulfide isomerase/thioredoxin
MKIISRIWVVALLFTGLSSVHAQIDTISPYLKSGRIPAFSIPTIPDSNYFAHTDLKPGLPFIVMIFSPECSHCKEIARSLAGRMELLEGFQILMVSSMPMDRIRFFAQETGISNYQNVILGKDQDYSVGKFYRIRTLPSLYLYNEKGQFVRKFEFKDIEVEQILDALKNE